jgi:hypothetical protein
MAKKKWMQAARERMKRKGTVGSFSRAAKRAGMSTAAYARKVLKKGSKASAAMKKKAAFAKAAGKVARRRKKK